MGWTAFPHGDAYERDLGALSDDWQRLHLGDRAEWPDQAWVGEQLQAFPEAAPEDFDGDIAGLARSLQEAWQAFHAGRFEDAVRLGDRAGLLGHAPANKASGIQGSYLEDDPNAQQSMFQDAIRRAEAAIAALPEDPNSHYFHAFNLGRFSQSISVVKALKQGIGGKIHTSLQKALHLEPAHAEAHTAMGLYHAEIINKVGKMIGSMTYGASADAAVEHFRTALELFPDSAIAHVEYGNGLYLLYGDKRLDEVTELYVKASELEPKDAMERLDVEAARAELE